MNPRIAGRDLLLNRGRGSENDDRKERPLLVRHRTDGAGDPDRLCPAGVAVANDDVDRAISHHGKGGPFVERQVEGLDAGRSQLP